MGKPNGSKKKVMRERGGWREEVTAWRFGGSEEHMRGERACCFFLIIKSIG